MQPARFEPTVAGAFTFRQPPRSVQQAMAYRDPRQPLSSSPAARPRNIMTDPRVRRGSAYAPPTSQRVASRDVPPPTKRQPRPAARPPRAVPPTHDPPLSTMVSQTPDPPAGRRYADIQTEAFLVEVPVETGTGVPQETQTDPLADRPPTPLYVPLKRGQDAETQIEDGELFAFDVEVDPILDVMVGKSLEQAMLEVQQEEELEALRQQQVEFEQRRKEELLETQQLAAAERRRVEEKERRKRQEKERMEREKVTREKLRSRMVAKSFLVNLENRVFARLEDEGWFEDPIRREVELEFMPWLTSQVNVELDRHRHARQVVDDLLLSTIQQCFTA